MPRFEGRPRTIDFGLRMLASAAVVLLAGALPETASADPYKWCAVYGGADNGGTNCYFMTLEQCRATVSGAGGFCQPNGFYDGRPVTGSGSAPTLRRGRDR
jgi:hypothetical protein